MGALVTIAYVEDGEANATVEPAVDEEREVRAERDWPGVNFESATDVE